MNFDKGIGFSNEETSSTFPSVVKTYLQWDQWNLEKLPTLTHTELCWGIVLF